MEQFQEKYNRPKLNKEEGESLYRPITADKIEAVILKLPTHKALSWMVSQENSTEHLGRANPYPSQTI